MDINNIQALIAQGLLTDVASVDPNKAYVAVGIFQPGNRPAGSANANSYPSYAMPISEFLAAGGIYTGSNGIALVGNDFQLASLNISQFTNDSNYVAGTGTIGYIPRWDLTDTLGNSVIFDDGLGKVGISTITPSEKLEVNGNIKLTTLANKYKIGAYDALSITQGVGSPNIIIGHGNTMNDASNGGGIVIGAFATSSSDGIAIGLSALVNLNTEDGIAIGREAVVSPAVIRGIAIGRQATSSADNAVAIGNYTLADIANTIILANNSSGIKPKVGIGTNNPLSLLYVNSSVQNEQITLNNDDITGSSYFALSQSGLTKAGMILLNSNHPFIPKTLIIRNLWDNGFVMIKGGSTDTSMMEFDTNNGNIGIGQVPSVVKVDIVNNSVNPIFRLRSNTFIFDDHLRVDNDGGFRSTSSNAFGAGGIGTMFIDHAYNTLAANGQQYLYYTNSSGANVHGIIGGNAGLADAAYRLKIYQDTTASVLQLISVGAVALNDGFDYTVYNANISSTGIITNAGPGTTYKVGINLDIINGDVNRAINIENGLIRVVKANQPAYGTLTSGEFYYNTAANILANGDWVVGMKA